MKLMLQKNDNSEHGFITMIVIMVVILAAVLFVAYQRVKNAS